MYCAGRFSMTVQPAITTSGVMNAVSTISGIEMPSTPSVYQALKAPIHGSCSTNCMAAVVASKSRQSTTLTTNVTQRRGEREPARDGGVAVPDQQQQHAGRDRQPDQHAQDGPVSLHVLVVQLRQRSHASRTERPMIVAKA